MRNRNAIRNTEQIATGIIDSANMLMVAGQISDVNLANCCWKKSVRMKKLNRSAGTHERGGRTGWPRFAGGQISNDLHVRVDRNQKNKCCIERGHDAGSYI